MRVSIVISVYNSHEALRRQLLHFKAMHLPEDVEIIIMDDGSRPPLTGDVMIIRTGSLLAWTQGLGRNKGAIFATGEYLLMTDIDHILTREAIEDVRNFTGDRMFFRRYFGALDYEGRLLRSEEELYEYGLDVDHLGKRGMYASVHLNTFAIKRSTFELLGGYDPKHSLVGFHPVSRKGDDCYFNAKWNKYARQNNLQLAMGADIYMFPIGRYHIRGETNPNGFFHDLKYDGQQVMNKGEEYA